MGLIRVNSPSKRCPQNESLETILSSSSYFRPIALAFENGNRGIIVAVTVAEENI